MPSETERAAFSNRYGRKNGTLTSKQAIAEFKKHIDSSTRTFSSGYRLDHGPTMVLFTALMSFTVIIFLWICVN